MSALQPSVYACLNASWAPGLDTALRLAIAVGLLAVLFWSATRRYYPGQRPFGWLLVAMLGWLAGSGAQAMAQSPDCRMALALATWPALMLVAPLWMLFLRQYLRSDYAPLAWPWRVLALAPAVAMGVAAATNADHGLLYGPATEAASLGPLRMRYDHGPLFYAAAAANYACALAALVLLAAGWARGQSPLRREQILTFALLTALPWAANIAYVAFDVRVLGTDPTPLSFAFAVLGLALLMRRGQLFRVVPLARRLLVDELPDPVLVLDLQRRVMEANRAALALAGLQRDWEARELGRWPVFGTPLCNLLDAGDGAALLRLDDPPRAYELHRRELGAAPRRIGWLLQLRDVTASHRAQQQVLAALEERDAQLERASRERSVLREQALRDPLTGLYNRRALVEVYSRTAQRQAAMRRPMVLALMDADHFKQINDQYGHAVGDEVLKALASTLGHALRASDDLFRIGGEEFLVLMPGADAASAKERLDGLRERLVHTPFQTVSGALTLTLSIGVAEWPVCGSTLDDLLRAADAALYSAKLQGRDRSVLAVFDNTHTRFVASRG